MSQQEICPYCNRSIPKGSRKWEIVRMVRTRPDMTMKEIGARFDISAGRVRQIFIEAVGRGRVEDARILREAGV